MSLGGRTPQRKGVPIMPKALVIALVAVLVAGCSVWNEYVRLLKAPYTGPPYSVTYIDGRAVRTYHYPAPDPLGSVHEFRPDIYYRMFPKSGP